jgi:hypothetical protein
MMGDGGKSRLARLRNSRSVRLLSGAYSHHWTGSQYSESVQSQTWSLTLCVAKLKFVGHMQKKVGEYLVTDTTHNCIISQPYDKGIDKLGKYRTSQVQSSYHTTKLDVAWRRRWKLTNLSRLPWSRFISHSQDFRSGTSDNCATY